MRLGIFAINLSLPFWLPLLACDENKAPPADAPPQPAFLVPARPLLPEPYAQPNVSRPPTVLGWPDGQRPVAGADFQVHAFARGLNNPRWLYVLPDGGVLVSESSFKGEAQDAEVSYLNPDKAARMATSADRILLLQDSDNDGIAESSEPFLSGLNQPTGMLLLGTWFYVANTDSLQRFPYSEGQICGPGEKILDLPAGLHNERWSRTLTASPDGTKIYIAVGAASQAYEYGPDVEARRASILEINPDGSGEDLFATGLFQVMGMDWTDDGQLWAAVRERKGLGEGLVPDFLTAVSRKDFYGWPFAYYGQNPDPRLMGQRPDLVGSSRIPSFSLGAHGETAGMTFAHSQSFPEAYRKGAFVAQHGSTASSELVGYQVIFVRFDKSSPIGRSEVFLGGFITDRANASVWGRPHGLAMNKLGDLLVADDAGDVIWLVRAKAPSP